MPSRSTRIKFLLVVDVIFFFVELIAGYAVGSLALVADSFHMLNDVLSLIVALYAIKLTKSEANTQYSYGWHRAEIVAALTNGVFLLALCFSIVLEAIGRFFHPSEITNPKLIVIVGSWGLLSNFLGLYLFHEHTHSHEDEKPKGPGQKTGESIVGVKETESVAGETPTVLGPDEEPHQHTSLYGHPAVTRAPLVQAAQDIGHGGLSSPGASPRRKDVLIDIEEGSGSDNDRQLLQGESRPENPTQGIENNHTSHSHVRGEHGGSSGSMNMHALILHVIGDALGNVGVIATGLVIWLSTWQYKQYFDPMISLVITCIIFVSALPLVRSTSFILLQAVPSTVSLKDIREDIQKVSGVLSVHELHIWQLSETKIVASVHVWVSRKREYMHVTQDIRTILHEHGVHSSTIQPELHDAPEQESLITDQEPYCLVPCSPYQACAAENACCPPQKPPLVDV